MFWRKTQRLRDTLDGTKDRVLKYTLQEYGPHAGRHRPTDEEQAAVVTTGLGLSWARHCGQWMWLVRMTHHSAPQKEMGFKGRRRDTERRTCGTCAQCNPADVEGTLWRKR